MIQFQVDAKEALEAETPDSQKLEHLIDFGITLDIDLSEIPKLKQVHCVGFLSTATQIGYLNETDVGVFDN